MVDIVKDEELLKELNAIVEKENVEKTYDVDGSKIELDQKTIEILNKKLEDDKKTKQSEPNWFDNLVSSTVEMFTGDKKTEFPNMNEIYDIPTKSLAKSLAINVGTITNADPMAHIDMLYKAYPGSVLSKDKNDNIMITIPKQFL